MDKVRMNNADKALLEAYSTWWASRLEDDPALQEAMQAAKLLVDNEYEEELASLLYDILGRAGDMVAEAGLKYLL